MQQSYPGGQGSRSFSMPPAPAVNEVLSERVRVHDVMREKKLSLRSQETQRLRSEAHAEARQRCLSASAMARLRGTPGQASADGASGAAGRAFKMPNAHCYPQHQRQMKMQMRQGDGKAHLLTRVFLNGEWVYTA
mmetsp:Transcript_72594/g.212944  ORF Transcript_72594/g.212944 Transcript_72594/m.212944 type:complete len:135 (+) Transcript_72594:58-462(+)